MLNYTFYDNLFSGLEQSELALVCEGDDSGAVKTSRRDLPYVLSKV